MGRNLAWPHVRETAAVTALRSGHRKLELAVHFRLADPRGTGLQRRVTQRPPGPPPSRSTHTQPSRSPGPCGVIVCLLVHPCGPLNFRRLEATAACFRQQPARGGAEFMASTAGCSP